MINRKVSIYGYFLSPRFGVVPGSMYVLVSATLTARLNTFEVP